MLDKLISVSRQIDSLNQKVGIFLRWLMVLLIAVASYNAIARYLGKFIGVNLSSNSFLEIQWYFFSIIFLLGGGYALLHNVHVRVDVIFERFDSLAQSRLNFWGAILFLIPFSIFILWVSSRWIFNSWIVWEMSPDPGGLPVFPIKTMIFVGFILLLLQGISEVIKNFALIQELKQNNKKGENS